MKRLSALRAFSKRNIYRLLIALPAVAALTLSSCNSKEEDAPAYEPAVSVAVTNFSISPNAKVMADLDSVFFSIDLDRGIIFNADSLPKWTAIDKLVPVITYPSTVEKAVINMTGGSTRTGSVDYTENPTDSIDFSGNVTLTLTADNLERTYTIRVNVHKMVADSLMWDKVAVAPLPSRLANPKEQRTVAFGKKVFTLLRESDNSLTLSSCESPADKTWQRNALSLPFTPDIRSLNASDNALYILSDAGELYSSTDGAAWTAVGKNWLNIIGGFSSSILGISRDASGNLIHDVYPQLAGYTPQPLDPSFPIENLSEFHTFSTKWATEPMGFFVGGERDGKYSDATWSFDGTQWAVISNTPLPKLSSPLIIPYFNYRKTTTSWIQTEYSVFLCIGGRLADGSLNPSVYISYDNGVNWQKAPTLLQLPDYVAATYAADAAIVATPMNASLDAYWQQKSTPSPKGARISYFVDGSDVDWDCPYIYLFGGIGNQGNLNNEILRAVLARLTFSPLF